MNLLLSDISLPEGLPECSENHYIDLSRMNIKNCMGCFGCWVKTPGRCVIRDDAVKIYPLIARSERLIYVSRLFYGSYDVTMKRMLERAIPIQKAFIRLCHGETHHVQRNVVSKHAVFIAYGHISEREQDVFRSLVARNARNMMISSWEIHFVPEEKVWETMLSEVRAWGNC